jgi:hypothetical protein
MFWPVVAFTGARRTLVDDILRHTRPLALYNGYGYGRCIATVWHWEYPVRIACRFLGGICFHLDRDDVGSWRFFTISIDSCNFGRRVSRLLPACLQPQLLLALIQLTTALHHSHQYEHTLLHPNTLYIRLNAVRKCVLFCLAGSYRGLPLPTRDTIPASQTRIIDVAAADYHDNFTPIYRG